MSPADYVETSGMLSGDVGFLLANRRQASNFPNLAFDVRFLSLNSRRKHRLRTSAADPIGHRA